MYFLEITDPKLLNIFKLFTKKLFYLETHYGLNKKYEKALLQSSKIGNLELIKYLVEKSANIHSKNDATLQNATKNSHINIVKYLIENGEDIHAEDDVSLQYATKNNYKDIINFFKKKMIKKKLI
jgi:ankyrin repeat protein